jgi:coenzyme F420-reducing hydrogenase beta subunit
MYVHNIKTENLVSIYRGIGWPGHNVFEYENGEKILISRRPKSLIEQAHHTLSFFPIFAQKKCLLCIDRFASYADISVGDAWLPKFKNDSKETSLIIVRNNKAKKILEDMKERGYLYYDKISECEILESQKIFSCFYKNFYTTFLLFKDVSREKIPHIKVVLPNNLNYRWLILLLLIKLGWKLSRNRLLWNQLFIYGLFFNFFSNFLVKY